MIFAGIDLAAREKNITGIAIINGGGIEIIGCYIILHCTSIFPRGRS